MDKKDWYNLKINQTIYYGPKKTPRVINDIYENKSVAVSVLHKTKSGCPETIYSKNERHLFHLTNT